MSTQNIPGIPEQDSFEENPTAPEGDQFSSPTDLREVPAVKDNGKATGEGVHYDNKGEAKEKVATEAERPKKPTTQVGDGSKK